MTVVIRPSVGHPAEEDSQRAAAAVLAVLKGWRPRRSDVARYLEEGGDPRGAVMLGDAHQRQLEEVFAALLGGVWLLTAHRAAQEVGRPDPLGSGVALWARRRAADIVENSQEALRGIAGWLNRRDDEWTQAGVIVRSVGQTLPGATATESYRRGMLSGGVITQKMASERADRNADHRLRMRADTIASNEAHSARLSGTQAGAAALAHPEGYAVFRAWEGACPECQSFDGMRVPLGDPAAGDGIHVNCLCDWEFVAAGDGG